MAMGNIFFDSSRAPAAVALAADHRNARVTAPDDATAIYDGVTLAEDVVWRGKIFVKGFVVIAPQATLRVEPGTVIRFTNSQNMGAARLVVQGRIQALGTAASPILLTSGQSETVRGDWSGITFVSSEKRNILEHCRIEYASCGIDARFSSINLKMVAITKSLTALRAHDSVVHVIGGTVTESETGIEAHDSEFEVRDSTIADCQRGFVMYRSSVGLSATRIKGNERYGLLSEDCRIKISSGELSENGNGARFTGGEGQILLTRFLRNRETALHLSGARMKIQHCLFAENRRDAIRLEDGRALVSSNAFSANNGFNLYNAGREDVQAVLNWWGSTDQSVITQKNHDAVRDPRSGSVQVFPWLTEKPPLIP